MPQQHPGRLQILVVDAHCKRRLFSTKTPTDPDELARRFCTPDNCLVVVLRDGNDSNLLIVFYVQIMPDDFVMQLHRF